ncbi:hypothetical protein HPB48_000761 [Haemaphysalis longicornis]|uniref:Uncharacterized protein n=1 Tax=Haemaphysalis longicornis TaxID=44386 RepID=A0A9J6GUZ8_HAELO|nr:hypothetical protein HPB48_000761 [Haemaphysalis longicornis]
MHTYELWVMGKSCFVPRCSTGYKYCRENISLFSAPKDEGKLNVWRLAVPRKDRLLQPTDYVSSDGHPPRRTGFTGTASWPRSPKPTKQGITTIHACRSRHHHRSLRLPVHRGD